MPLSPEDRHRIYEEEKARMEAEQKSRSEQQTITSLRPGVAGLLCYLGGWITGIVFLVLEQKSRFVRFHAAQSIVVFGFLNIVFLILRPIPFFGGFFGIVIGVMAFILWIVLMVKAAQEDYFKLPVAGDLAEKLLGAAAGTTAQSSPGPSPSSAPPTSTESVASSTKAEPMVRRPAVRTASPGRAGRIATSAFVVAWSVALLVFLNFFHDYIAYYHLETAGAVSHWIREPVVTQDFHLWLPIVNAVLAFSIAGHIIMLAVDKYIVRESTLFILDILSMVSIIALLSIFPFDFRPFGQIASAIDLSVRVTLALIIFVIAIGVLVRLIKIVVNVARGTASY